MIIAVIHRLNTHLCLISAHVGFTLVSLLCVFLKFSKYILIVLCLIIAFLTDVIADVIVPLTE